MAERNFNLTDQQKEVLKEFVEVQKQVYNYYLGLVRVKPYYKNGNIKIGSWNEFYSTATKNINNQPNKKFNFLEGAKCLKAHLEKAAEFIKNKNKDNSKALSYIKRAEVLIESIKECGLDKEGFNEKKNINEDLEAYYISLCMKKFI